MALEVRRVRREDADTLKAIRLAALEDAPSAFGSTYAEAVLVRDDEWPERALAGSEGFERATFFAISDGVPLGLVGGYRDDPAASTVNLVSMWTAPNVRRLGIGRALVDAVLRWASDGGAASVELWVTEGNDPALRLYEQVGFEATSDRQPLPSDPSKDEIRMTLAL